MTKRIWFCLAAGFSAMSCDLSDDATGSYEGETIYAKDSLATFELTISDECKSALAADPDEYCSGDIRYRPSDDPTEDIVLSNVGIRLKGRASFQYLDGKPSFKIKLDEYVDNQRLLGLRRLTFNNMAQDASMVRERLGYLLFRAAGVPAPLCNSARVLVNGEYYGLYANLETLDDEFAEHRFDPAPGNLFDTSNDSYFVDFLPEWRDSFVLETNKDEADISDLDALISGVNGPAETFFSDAGEVIDWDEFLTVGATRR
jgi:spore coat protein CotH